MRTERKIEISEDEYLRLTVGRSIYDDQLLQRANRARRRPSNAPAWAMFIVIALVGATLAIPYALERLAVQTTVGGPASPAPAQVFPTSNPAQRLINSVNAVSTDAEAQTIKQEAPAPAPDAAQPAPAQEEITAQEAQSFSPIDLGFVPVPTPTSGLPPEQFEAAQASEEQNQINTQLSGLTPAQQMVKVHEAEWAASNP